MLTFSEENYLKAIFHLEQKFDNGANTNSLAKKMETKPSSVTDMVKKLADKKLVNYKKYQGAKLSQSGKETAIKVIRKHRLWEVFLVEKLEFSWDEVHEIAEQLEHIKSEKLTRQLDKFLGYPKRDPHGDPIPNEKGNFTVYDNRLLSELEIGKSGICMGVKDSSPTFLRYLDKINIALGEEISVVEKESFDQSIKIKTNNEFHTISNLTANNLYIKTL
ncbi:MAG TPA: metal-dependent transcriptional regulator [Flavobacteriaceae bacterium]|nr:metal-dependent transcriptional regulator [Flavobacteriaceae bacterium]